MIKNSYRNRFVVILLVILMAVGVFEIIFLYKKYNTPRVELNNVEATNVISNPTELPLLEKTDLVYEGAFKVPDGFGYGGGALTFDSLRNGLFIAGYEVYGNTGEIGIPQIINSDNLADLATAPLIQGITDVTEGARINIVSDPAEASNGIRNGGHLVYNNKLYTSQFLYYGGAGVARSSHFVSSTDLTQQGDSNGPFRVGSLEPGYVAGYMASIPSAWQGLLGAPAVTGQCCISVISARSSAGPSLFAFDPSTVGVQNPSPATPLVLYHVNDSVVGPHETLGGYYDGGVAGPYYAGGTAVAGVVFPEDTRSVLFVGVRGIGPDCYGTHIECNDVVEGKGPHAPPYVFQVWAYDANDFLAVKNGQKQPWEVVPYTGWELPEWAIPWANKGHVLGGVAYDPSAQRVFVSQMYGNGSEPVIRVFKVVPPSQNRPQITFTVTPSGDSSAVSNINRGESGTINWNVIGAASVSIDNGIGSVSSSGSLVVNPTRSTAYKITATNTAGTSTKYVKIRVNFPTPPIINSFTITPSTIQKGQSATLAWSTTNVATAIISGFGLVEDSGSIVVTPLESKEYSIAVSNPQMHYYSTVTLEVTPSGYVDNIQPNVSITAPVNGATISGQSVTVSATATDNLGVEGVQFKLNGSNLGVEDSLSPYSITFDTTKVSNGSHTLTAVARDASGNSRVSSAININVSNAEILPPAPVPAPPPPPPSGGGGGTRPTPTPVALVPRHYRGALVNHNGTIYFLGTELRYPFPSAEVFLSWGVKFEDVVPANSGDIAMAIGPVVQFKTENATRHPRGALVNHNGTVYFMGNLVRYPFPSAAVFLSWGVKFEDVVPANSGDIAVPTGPVVEFKK